MKAVIAFACLLGSMTLIANSVSAEENIATLRGGSIEEQWTPPRIGRTLNSDVKPQRNYPMQPPTIPHKIDGYQVDLNVNRCMACHSRRNTLESQATMISVTHYMDRDGNFLAEVSPRRFFCKQCHVTQTDVGQLLSNEFVDIDEILRQESGEGR